MVILSPVYRQKLDVIHCITDLMEFLIVSGMAQPSCVDLRVGILCSELNDRTKIVASALEQRDAVPVVR